MRSAGSWRVRGDDFALTGHTEGVRPTLPLLCLALFACDPDSAGTGADDVEVEPLCLRCLGEPGPEDRFTGGSVDGVYGLSSIPDVDTLEVTVRAGAVTYRFTPEDFGYDPVTNAVFFFEFVASPDDTVIVTYELHPLLDP